MSVLLLLQGEEDVGVLAAGMLGFLGVVLRPEVQLAGKEYY